MHKKHKTQIQLIKDACTTARQTSTLNETRKNVRHPRRRKLGRLQPVDLLNRLLVSQMFRVFQRKKIARSKARISKISYVEVFAFPGTTIFVSVSKLSNMSSLTELDKAILVELR